MSFLEQHFYIDAGINLPCDKIGMTAVTTPAKDIDMDRLAVEFEHSLNLIKDKPPGLATVSVENVDLERMTESELKSLEMNTNITDDVKVNLRKRGNKKGKSVQKGHFSRDDCDNLRSKRYSSVYSVACIADVKKKTVNRRSLNVNDMSRIPCLRKPKGNSEVKSVSGNKIGQACSSKRVQSCLIKKNEHEEIKSPVGKTLRPKSEIILNGNKNKLPKALASNMAYDDSIINVPIIKNDITSSKPSALPILKR